MTNGEKLKEIFPYLESDDTDLVKVLNIDNLKSWWNAEDKEPTTKNCETCRYDGSHHEVCDYCYKCSLWTEQESTTNNDLPHCKHTDEEIAKSFIEDVEAVKDQLPCGEQMDFPNTFDEFAKDYGFKDKNEIYTNGSELIPVFRVKQWLEHIAITKNDLGVDCVSRKEVFETIDDCNRDGLKGIFCSYDDGERFKEYIKNLSPITPQLSSELEKNSKKLEKDFGELDCIPRAEAIRVASGYCHPSNVAKELAKLPSVTPQEPKTGHWIKYGIPRCGEQHYKCTNCDEYFNFGLYSDYYKKAFKYCPNCGAKMADRSEEDGNDD